ncbi:MAG TPA: MaoC family dehydratase [Mycobacteriales bacterium]|nr:MaoC family dehydratase [Mycobacteriales bacterium]
MPDVTPDPAGGGPVERYLEDYPVGLREEFGPIQVDEAEIVEFARRYDAQPFHVDPAAAAAGPYGGLIASGWHTCALMMQLLVRDYLSPASSLGSPGVDELRWIRPVRPGDRLVLRTTVLESRRSRSRPDRGILRTQVELADDSGQLVLTMTAINLVLSRPTA